MQRLNRYLDGTRRYPAWRLILELVALSYAGKVAVGLLWAPFDGHSVSTTEAIDTGGPWALFLGACVVGPPIETFIGQWLPMWALSAVTKRTAWLVGFSVVFFAALHLYVGFFGFLTVLPAAAVLAWAFFMKRERSFWDAWWITTVMHALHNLIAVSLYYVGKAGA